MATLIILSAGFVESYMKKTTLFSVFILLSSFSFSQLITGKITDSQTKDPIWYASVYFNGSLTGTVTDQEGNFRLDISKYSNMPVTVSAIGYYSVEISGLSTDSMLLIALQPKVYPISEVVISPDKTIERKRKDYLNLFRTEFLGVTYNSDRCKIMNESDLSFNYYSDQDTLKAFASKPLQIENRALGYNITYYLDKFEYYKKQKRVYFQGSIQFSEAVTFRERPQQYYDRKRKYAYLGSRMHFFRTLFANDSTSTGFAVYDSVNTRLSFTSVVSNTGEGYKFLKVDGSLIVYYYQTFSRITFLLPAVYFDENGYFDPNAVEWDGDLARSRIADWLPYEYVLE